MSGRLYNLDTERGRRRPFASTPATRDALARVVVLEPGPVAPLEPPRQSLLVRTAGSTLALGLAVWTGVSVLWRGVRR